jgi:hypothetical protein
MIHLNAASELGRRNIPPALSKYLGTFSTVLPWCFLAGAPRMCPPLEAPHHRAQRCHSSLPAHQTRPLSALLCRVHSIDQIPNRPWQLGSVTLLPTPPTRPARLRDISSAPRPAHPVRGPGFVAPASPSSCRPPPFFRHYHAIHVMTQRIFR